MYSWDAKLNFLQQLLQSSVYINVKIVSKGFWLLVFIVSASVTQFR